MNVVDSSGWLEYFADSKRANLFARSIENTSQLIVPVISTYEVFKKLLQVTDEDRALTAIAHMQMGKVVDIDQELAMTSARISNESKIPMANSIIWATTLRYKATLWTQDEDFLKITGKIKYFPK